MANYVLLQRIELNASASSVSFTNIPQSGYTDLKVVASMRTTRSGDINADIGVTFNGNTSSYSIKDLLGYGSGVASRTNPVATSSIADVFATGASTTSNTFSTYEMYIPNYTSSNYKSVSIDATNENNATSNYSLFAAGSWSNTSAITSITFTPLNSDSFVQYSTFSLYGIADVNTTPAIAPKASGGNITTDGTYWIHTFNSTGAFVPTTSFTCDALVVAGGGSGGRSISGGYAGAGGGGGGGFRTASLSVTATPYTVTVGAGGATVSTAGAFGNDGTSSTFSTVSSAGGGGGGYSSTTGSNGIGRDGGSGGGGTYSSGAGRAGGLGNTPSTSPGQGYNGGSGQTSANNGGGGGGGAGAVGQDATTGPSSGGGAGGAGASNSYSGSAVTYAGGGGGGTYDRSGGAGGTGGGGAGGASTGSGGSAGTNGTTNLGGGGGGGTTGTSSGSGGSGIVIIRYSIA